MIATTGILHIYENRARCNLQLGCNFETIKHRIQFFFRELGLKESFAKLKNQGLLFSISELTRICLDVFNFSCNLLSFTSARMCWRTKHFASDPIFAQSNFHLCHRKELKHGNILPHGWHMWTFLDSDDLCFLTKCKFKSTWKIVEKTGQCVQYKVPAEHLFLRRSIVFLIVCVPQFHK